MKVLQALKRVADRQALTAYGYLLVMNLVSGGALLMVMCTMRVALSVFAVSAMLAAVETAVYIALRRHKVPRRIYMGLLAAVYTLLILLEYFLRIKFGVPLSTEVLDAIAATDSGETSNFFASYVTPLTWLAVICGLPGVNLVAWGAGWLAGRFRRVGATVAALATLCGVGYVCFAAVAFVRYRHADSIQDYSAPTRLAYTIFKREQNLRQTRRLQAVCDRAEAKLTAEADFDILLIVGESYSRYRCPLYGYDKPVTPRLSAMAADSSLVVMRDVVTPFDWTNKVLTAVWSPTRVGQPIDAAPLFPVLFRKAGRPVALYDNEFSVNGTGFFFTDRRLSEQMYDYRTARTTRYDGHLLDSLVTFDRPAMHIVHLIGQHFTYSDRYPAGAGRFTAGDYDSRSHSASQREVMAAYDNATLYNDSVVGALIDRFAGGDAVAVYFSDHGEEVYDVRDYFGHGNASTAPDKRYQIEVPMVVWMSDTFRRLHPDKVSAIRRAATRPMTTDDLAHFLLDLGNVSAQCFDPTRSALNDAYDATRHRIVLTSVDYDATLK